MNKPIDYEAIADQAKDIVYALLDLELACDEAEFSEIVMRELDEAKARMKYVTRLLQGAA